MRIIKLGLGLVAVLVFTVAMASGASASSFLSSKAEKLLSSKVAKQVFTTEEGTVECTEAKIENGSTTGAEATVQLALIKYGNCVAFTFVEVEISEADYLFEANGNVKIDNLIKIFVPFNGCEVSVPPQTVGTVSYDNNSNGNLQLLPNVSGILYTANKCTKNGHFNTGTYKGNAEAMIPNGTVSFMA